MTTHDLQTLQADAPEDESGVLFSSISLFFCW